MTIIALLIFAFCSWAVFSQHFCDGIIAKHLLAFAAILSVLVILDPKNAMALITACVAMIAGIAYWFFKHARPVIHFLKHIKFSDL